MEGELAGANRKNKLKYGVNGLSFKEIILSPTLTNRKIKGKTFNHSSRQSLSTILIESGTYLRCLQELLGYKSSMTTEIYTHVSTKNLSEIKNLLDFLLERGEHDQRYKNNGHPEVGIHKQFTYPPFKAAYPNCSYTIELGKISTTI